MEIHKKYDPTLTEEKWYAHWIKQGFFKSSPDDREPYTIVIPPPNVTGVLHMGHMLNNTIQDVLIRLKRMQGYNACWVPGTDHASIATEAKVVALLKEKGIEKSDLTREEFLKHAWEWKEKYGGIILKQLEKLGASCDWDRTRFTMEEPMSESVIDVFIDLYKKGYIYKGVRMVNWDPDGLTAVSDEEVIHKEVNSKLFYVKYKIEGIDNEWITIATTRPETILGDSAICVHPKDERFKHLAGKKAIVPMVNRSIPIIFDDYIDIDFGTGALKVTPAHDVNDYNLGVKHKLEVIDTIAPNGKMSEAAQFYVGEDRFVVRKKIIKDLDGLGQLVKVEDIKNKVGYSERTDAVIEPRLSMQWFLKMEELGKPALDNVLNGNIKLIPKKFINTYKHWMENVHDWCISRQLWWGQQIPAWYDKKGNIAVCKTKEEAFDKLKTDNPDIKLEDIRQDEDVLDTWFSSWLWPISVFDGFNNPQGEDINYYYPTNDLVTAPEILFFWVARMIIAGYEFKGELPFKNVYLTGIVRDKQGRKMSKSLGNSPDPIELIEKYGADGVRVGMLLCSPAGNDLPFDEGLCLQGRNFSNKIWNAFRLLKGFEVSDDLGQSKNNQIAIKWFTSTFNEQLRFINEQYTQYRMSEALMATYKLVWDDYCSWYLEMIKPAFVDGKALPIDKTTYDASIAIFENLLKVLHPFMPFISEEIWHLISERNEKECVIVSTWPEVDEKVIDTKIQEQFINSQKVISAIREFRNKNGISPKQKFTLFYKGENNKNDFGDIIKKLANLESIEHTSESVSSSYSFVLDQEYYIPVESSNSELDKERIIKEIEYNKGFLVSVNIKLANEKFVANAKPELVEKEKSKKVDAEAKIKALEEQLANM